MKIHEPLFDQLKQFVDVELMEDGDYYLFNVLGDKVRITAPVLAMLALEIKNELAQENLND